MEHRSDARAERPDLAVRDDDGVGTEWIVHLTDEVIASARAVLARLDGSTGHDRTGRAGGATVRVRDGRFGPVLEISCRNLGAGSSRLVVLRWTMPDRSCGTEVDVRAIVADWTRALEGSPPPPAELDHLSMRRRTAVHARLDQVFGTEWKSATIHPGTSTLMPSVTVRMERGFFVDFGHGASEALPLHTEMVGLLTDRNTRHVRCLGNDAAELVVSVDRAPTLTIQRFDHAADPMAALRLAAALETLPPL